MFVIFKTNCLQLGFLYLIDLRISKGSIANLALSSLHGESFEITLTVPVNVRGILSTASIKPKTEGKWINKNN